MTCVVVTASESWTQFVLDFENGGTREKVGCATTSLIVTLGMHFMSAPVGACILANILSSFWTHLQRFTTASLAFLNLVLAQNSACPQTRLDSEASEYARSSHGRSNPQLTT